MAAWVGKKYKLHKSEGYDEFQKAMGVGMTHRLLGNKDRPTIELIKDGDTYTVKSDTTFKHNRTKFKNGEEFEEDAMDGSKAKSVYTFEGDNKLVHEIKGDHPATIISEFTATELTVNLTAGGVKSVRHYVAV